MRFFAICGRVRPAFFAACFICVAAFAQEKPKVALYIANDDLKPDEKSVLTSKFLASFTASGMYSVIDRSDVFTQKAVKERIKQTDGSVNEEDIYKIGMEAGAKYVCMVDLVKAFGRYNISARMVDVETAEIYLAQGEADINELDGAELSQAAKTIFRKIHVSMENELKSTATPIAVAPPPPRPPLPPPPPPLPPPQPLPPPPPPLPPPPPPVHYQPAQPEFVQPQVVPAQPAEPRPIMPGASDPRLADAGVGKKETPKAVQEEKNASNSFTTSLGYAFGLYGYGFGFKNKIDTTGLEIDSAFTGGGFGISLGITARVQLLSWLSLNPELNIAGKWLYTDGAYYDDGPEFAIFVTDYTIDVPILLRLTGSYGFYTEIGAQIAIPIYSGYDWEEDYDTSKNGTWNLTSRTPVNVGFVFGIGMNGFGARVTVGLTKFDKTGRVGSLVGIGLVGSRLF